MSRDDYEPLPTIPQIVPGRDADTQRTPRRRRQGGRKAGGSSHRAAPGGTGVWARLFITLALVVAAVACAWAFQLQQQLQVAGAAMDGYERRISELEARLSDTDEGMTQSAAAMAVQVKELRGKVETNFSEIDKLWASAWRKNKAAIEELNKQAASLDQQVGESADTLATLETTVDGAAADIARLKSVAGDLSRLMSSARANQEEVERVADTLNRITLDLAKLDKRVQSSEEWVGSVNAFRQQVNSRVLQLEEALRQMSAP